MNHAPSSARYPVSHPTATNVRNHGPGARMDKLERVVGPITAVGGEMRSDRRSGRGRRDTGPSREKNSRECSRIFANERARSPLQAQCVGEMHGLRHRLNGQVGPERAVRRGDLRVRAGPRGPARRVPGERSSGGAECSRGSRTMRLQPCRRRLHRRCPVSPGRCSPPPARSSDHYSVQFREAVAGLGA